MAFDKLAKELLAFAFSDAMEKIAISPEFVQRAIGSRAQAIRKGKNKTIRDAMQNRTNAQLGRIATDAASMGVKDYNAARATKGPAAKALLDRAYRRRDIMRKAESAGGETDYYTLLGPKKK